MLNQLNETLFMLDFMVNAWVNELQRMEGPVARSNVKLNATLDAVLDAVLNVKLFFALFTSNGQILKHNLFSVLFCPYK